MKIFKVTYNGQIEANDLEEARAILEGILYEAVEGEDLDAFEILELDESDLVG